MTRERVSRELIPQRIADSVPDQTAWEGVPRE